jgi:hypothetical protein
MLPPLLGRHALDHRGIARRALGLLLLTLLACAAPLHAQTTGTIVGQVVDAATQEPLASADVTIEPLGRTTVTGEAGRFVLAGVPSGQYTVRVELLSYRPVITERVDVRAGHRSNLTIELTAAAIEVEPLIVEAERIPLIEPEVSETHHIILGRQLRELAIDATEGAIELTTGVTDGRFRGGRIGQENYVVDGFALKNQLEGASQGLGLEFSPTSLEAIEVTTGGFGAEYGSALSGVVRFVTRRGDTEKWGARARLLSDHWMPNDFSRGFSELSVSTGGPLSFLGSGSTLFADLLLQGLRDADPRAKGLTCLSPEQVEPELAALIDSLTNDPSTAHLYCPYSSEMLPYQEGDKLIGFLRLDVPLGRRANLAGSLLRNRLQRQLYTSDFKYNSEHQLGQRLTGTLGSLAFDWAKESAGKAFHVTARAAAMRLDRYLGVVDPAALENRTNVAGFGFADYQFLGEDFVRRPIEEQTSAPSAVPGYSEPNGSTGSPFGPAAEGIFFTDGTPGIANWSRSDLLGGDLVGEFLSASGHSLRAGLSGRAYTVENYERPFAFAPDSVVNFARYHPATLAGFAELRLVTAQMFTATFGLRYESFRSGLSFNPDPSEPQAPMIDSAWKRSVMPRVGFAGAFRGSAGETAFRFNFSRLAQPPDFRFFVDTTIGDSLRTDIRRQGNPNLGFEEGRAFELGVSHVIKDALGISVTAFRKELTNLVTGSLQFATLSPGQFSTGDKGTIQGVEFNAYGRWPGLELRGGYVLQNATGLTSGAFDEDVDPEAQFEEFPLAFDRRHAFDLVVLGGRATGWQGTAWGGSLTASVRSGFPLDRAAAVLTRLPWTAFIGLRLTRDLVKLPLCSGCRTRIILDARNITGRDNVIALRRDTGGLGPPADDVLGAMNDIPMTVQPIPRESQRYNPLVDLDANGLITASELRSARVAAQLDRNDPSLYYGQARQLRLGLELVF